jgi:hypothetical protein
MSKFSLFRYLDPAIIDDESSTARASKTPAVWPSEASAVRVDKSLFPIFGACLRKQAYRMIGWPRKQETAAESPWKWIVGRAVEEKLTELAKYQSEKAGIEHIYVAHGVRLFIQDFYLPVEMDVIVRDPETGRGWIVECKTYDGYYAEKAIEKEEKPKEENLIQACIYLLEAESGAKLKKLIKKSIDERRKLDELNEAKLARGEKIFEHRNRSEASMEMVDKLDDGPLGCKLVYIARGTLHRTEFDIEIFEDFDGFHYPMVDGFPYKIFSIESIYERFRTGQNYWFRMRQEAVDLLAAKGIVPPETVRLILNRGDVAAPQTEDRQLSSKEWAIEKEYFERLEAEVRGLPESFFPPPEYEWSYSPGRIEELFAAKQLSKNMYTKFKKGEVTRLGDWQCGWCPYAATGCIQKQRPDLAYQVYDFANLPESAEVTIG